MRRRAFNTAAAVSLVLCVAVVAIWVRSYFIADYLTWTYGYGDRMGLGGNFREVDLDLRRGAVVLWERYHLIGELNGSRELPWGYPDGLQYKRGTSPANSPMEYPSPPYTNMPNVSDHRFAGCQIAWCRMTFRHKGSLDRYRWARLPLAYLVLILSVFPAASVRAGWRRHRVRKGHCTGCGYSLTGNTSGVCPECGTPATVAGVPA